MNTTETTTQPAGEIGRDPWYRKALGTTRFKGSDRRLWGQRLRDRDLGSGLRHTSGMAAGSRLRIGALALTLVAIIALLLGPLRGSISDVFSPPSDQIAYAVSVGGDAPDMPSESLDRLSDGSVQVGLELPWARILPPYACGDRQAYAIRLDFAEGDIPRELRIYISKDPVSDGESPELWPGPSLISIQGASGCLGPFDITTDAGWVSYDIESLVATGVWLEVYVHERHEDSAVDANPVLVIAEIELLG